MRSQPMGGLGIPSRHPVSTKLNDKNIPYVLEVDSLLLEYCVPNIVRNHVSGKHYAKPFGINPDHIGVHVDIFLQPLKDSANHESCVFRCGNQKQVIALLGRAFRLERIVHGQSPVKNMNGVGSNILSQAGLAAHIDNPEAA